ncbi:unnamed protein product [Caenorhabditis nigoni]
MTTKVIAYKSGQATVNGNASVLETAERDGIKYTCNGYVNAYYQAVFTWKFDWEDLKSQGVDRLAGQLIVKSVAGQWQQHKIDIDWTETNQSVSAALGVSYDDIFVASEKTDVILVVEGKKLHVNKTFLSIHSDYFSTLFSANFKEGQMKEIEIKEVSYEDFGLLLSSFHPNQEFPNDSTVEKLLEMASRFQVSSVIGAVEHHLLNNSKIEYEKMIHLADEYVMPKLLKKLIAQMNSLEKARKLEKSPEFEKLSDRTRSLILGRLLKSV